MTRGDSDTEIDPDALRRASMWWCGGCDSVIPIGYWHHCTEDMARSGPHNLSELRWAPYQEFGIPNPDAESLQAPDHPVTIGAVGYRGDTIVIYWQHPPAELKQRKQPSAHNAGCADGLPCDEHCPP